jgi:hypothetical protein
VITKPNSPAAGSRSPSSLSKATISPAATPPRPGSTGRCLSTFWDVWGPRTWWVYGKELLKGEKLHKAEGDVMQRGGDVLIDPNGIVRLHHVGEGPADRPAVETILALVAH